MGFDTAGNIIDQAARELGLGAVSSPYASSDGNIVQLCAFLTSAGREVAHEKQWTQLQKEATFTTVNTTNQYPLPSDFRAMINQTGWIRTTRLPLGGPLSPQEWQFLAARLVGVTFTVLFRPISGYLETYPNPPPAAQTIAYEYISTSWVQRSTWQAGHVYAAADTVQNDGNIYTCTVGGTSATAGGPSGTSTGIVDGTVTWDYTSVAPATPTADSPVADGDVIYFDPQLMVRAVKLAFLKQKGFDTTMAQADYERSLEHAKNDDTAAPILSADGRQLLRDPLLDAQNVPVTNFGS